MSTRPGLKALVYAFALIVIASTAWSRFARASEGKDGVTQVYTAFFGEETSRDNSANCLAKDSDAHLGIIGAINNIFCHLEKDMGIAAVGSVTKTFKGSNGVEVGVHCDVAASSGTYAHTASCWTCVGASCTAVTDYSRLFNLAWTFAADRSINKGALIMDSGAFAGIPGQTGISVNYDVGTSTTTKTMDVRGVTSGVELNVAAQRVGSVLSGQLVFDFDRFAITTDVVAGLSLVNFQTIGSTSCVDGFEAVSGTASNSTTCTQCLTRSKSGDDFVYTAALASACTSITLAAYPDNMTDVGAYTADATQSTTVLNQAVNGTVWNGMAANPSAL